MIVLKKITPMFTSIVTTMDMYSEVQYVGSIIDPTKTQRGISEYQKVLAVMKHREGTLKNGIVTDNPVMKYNFDVVEIDGKPCLLLQDRDISFIINEYEEKEDNPAIIHPDTSIIN